MIAHLAPYWSIFSVRSRALLQYRAAVLAGAATQLFWGLIRIMIFGAFYASSSAPQPISYAEVVTYIWISQALIALQPWGIDSGIRQTIASGQVAYELVRPLDLHAHWFARSLALRGIPTLMRGLLLFLVAGLFFQLAAPTNFASAAAFLGSLLAAWLLSAAITSFMTSTLLWTISGEGVTRLLPAILNLLSGNILPLALFPEWAQTFLYWQPFRALVDTPIQFYLGRLPPSALPGELLFTLSWSIFFYALGHLLIATAQKRIIIQGG